MSFDTLFNHMKASILLFQHITAQLQIYFSEGLESLLSYSVSYVFTSSFILQCCVKDKQFWLPFSPSRYKCNVEFELIHYDIRGGYHTTFHLGAYYFFIIVNDYSRSTWVCSMRFKYKILLIKCFISMVRTRLENRVRWVRTISFQEFLSL